MQSSPATQQPSNPVTQQPSSRGTRVWSGKSGEAIFISNIWPHWCRPAKARNYRVATEVRCVLMLSPSRQLPSVNRLSHLSTQAGIVCYCMQYTEPANSSQLTSFGFGFGFGFRVVDQIFMLNRFIFRRILKRMGTSDTNIDLTGVR